MKSPILNTIFHSLKTLILSLLLISTSIYADFAGGDGSVDNPYQISTIKQLNQVRDFADQNFILTNNLDFLGTTYDSTNSIEHKGWEPIVNFVGAFDGASHIISNLYIMRPEEDNVGLFSITYYDHGYGSIKNLGLTNTKVSGRNNVGAIVGRSGGPIDSCYVIGSIYGYTHVGGIAGDNYGSIYNNFSNGNVNGYSNVGGIVGYNNQSIGSCYSNSSVDGYEYVGGVAGVNTGYGYQDNCYGVGYVSGYIYSSYTTGSISGYDYVGGLIGLNEAQVRYSYANNKITVNASGTTSVEDKNINCLFVESCGPFSINNYCNVQESTLDIPIYYRGYNDSLDFRDTILVDLNYYDPNDNNTSDLIFNPDGFPYLRWQDLESLPLATLPNPDSLRYLDWANYQPPSTNLKHQNNQETIKTKFNYQNNRLNIYFNKTHNSTLSIYSLTGKLVLSKSYQSAQITQDLGHLNSSIYIVKVESLNGSYSDKILVK